jgi:hypothetical protein
MPPASDRSGPDQSQSPEPARLPEGIRHPSLIRLYEHWEAKRGARAMPSRTDFDPVDLSYILGHLLLMDVIGPPPWRFRYRLIGSELTQRSGRDLTGRMVDELPESEYRTSVIAWHTAVVEQRTPRRSLTRRVIDRRWQHYEILTMPLSSDGEAVDMTVTGVYYIDEQP